MLKKISVIGSGSWGTALAVLLADNGYKVVMWSSKEEKANRIERLRENREYLPGVEIPDSVKITCEDDFIKDSDIIVLTVTSKMIRKTMERFLPVINENQIIVNACKGLEDETLLRLSEVIKEVAPMCKIAVLSGPSHAEEVGRKMPTTCVASSENMSVAEEIQSVFMNPYFRVYTNSDIIGVELGGALKNLIALAAGISDGVGFGDNAKAALMTRGIVEISRLGTAMGAKSATFGGLSGIGDLIVTCTSMHSRNRRAGILLGQGKTLDETLEEIHMVVEGVNTVKAAYELSKKYDVEMPITKEIYDVLFNGKDKKQAVISLMTRNKTAEHEKEETIITR